MDLLCFTQGVGGHPAEYDLQALQQRQMAACMCIPVTCPGESGEERLDRELSPTCACACSRGRSSVICTIESSLNFDE